MRENPKLLERTLVQLASGTASQDILSHGSLHLSLVGLPLSLHSLLGAFLNCRSPFPYSSQRETSSEKESGCQACLSLNSSWD